MESKEGQSQELSKARTRLTFPRGRVVQPPLQPGIKPDPPPPRSDERDPPLPGTWEQRKWLFTLTLPAGSRSMPHLRTLRTVKHPEMSLRAPKGDSTRNFSCGRRRVPRALSCACARPLISSPAEKQGKPHGLAAGPYHAAAAVSFPLALPCHPAGLSPDGANNPPLSTERLSTPKSTLTLPPMIRAAPLTTLHSQSAQRGGLHLSGCSHPTVINPSPAQPCLSFPWQNEGTGFQPCFKQQPSQTLLCTLKNKSYPLPGPHPFPGSQIPASV